MTPTGPPTHASHAHRASALVGHHIGGTVKRLPRYLHRVRLDGYAANSPVGIGINGGLIFSKLVKCPPHLVVVDSNLNQPWPQFCPDTSGSHFSQMKHLFSWVIHTSPLGFPSHNGCRHPYPKTRRNTR